SCLISIEPSTDHSLRASGLAAPKSDLSNRAEQPCSSSTTRMAQQCVVFMARSIVVVVSTDARALAAGDHCRMNQCACKKAPPEQKKGVPGTPKMAKNSIELTHALTADGGRLKFHFGKFGIPLHA